MFIDETTGQLRNYNAVLDQNENAVVFTLGETNHAKPVTTETVIEFANANSPDLLFEFVSDYGALFGQGMSTIELLEHQAIVENMEALDQARIVLDECMRMRAFIDGQIKAL